MELGNEARAAAANAQLLLASAPPQAAISAGANGSCAGLLHRQRAWPPLPAAGALPYTAGGPVLCAWPPQWPWQPPGAWQPPLNGSGLPHGSTTSPAWGADDGTTGQVESAARQQDDAGGQASAASGRISLRRAGSPEVQPRDSMPARSALQPAVASSRSVLKPAQALIDLQIDGSGRAPGVQPPAAHEAARDGGQKLQTVTRGPRAQGRAQREALRGADRQRWPLRRVRNWNDTADA